MAQVGKMNEYYAGNFQFIVEFGENPLIKSGIGFAKVSGLEAAVETEMVQEGGLNDYSHVWIAPQKQMQKLTLEKGIAICEKDASSKLLSLCPGTHLGTWINIEVLDRNYKSTRYYFIEDGIITRWEATALDAMGNQILIDKFEIAHNGIHFGAL